MVCSILACLFRYRSTAVAQSDTDADIWGADPSGISADCWQIRRPQHSPFHSAVLRHGSRCWAATPGCWDF